MRVLVSAFGTIGDLHPLVGIAAAMRGRGHDVHLLANAAYEPLAAEAGVQFQPVGDAEELEKIKRHPKAWTYANGWKLWFRGAGLGPMRSLFHAIEELNRPGETVLAAHYLSFGARIAREKLRIPTATVHLNVHTIQSIYDIYAHPPPSFLPDCLPRGYLLPQWSSRWYRSGVLHWVERLYVDPVLSPEIREFRRELGLPELRTFVRTWWNSPDLVAGLFPPWWSGYHPDWPARVVMPGFAFWDRSESAPMDPQLQAFLEKAEGVIVFTPGASDNHSERHFAAFVQSCRKLGRQGVVITPRQPAQQDSSGLVRFERYVPFGRLFPYAGAVVHHAGIGTSASCLAAGLPQVVAPTLYNEPDTAIRLERLGVARQVSSIRFNERTLTRALDDVLTSPRIAANCRKYAELTRACDALSEICPHLESLLTCNRIDRR